MDASATCLIQTPKRPSAFSVSAKNLQREKLLTPDSNQSAYFRRRIVTYPVQYRTSCIWTGCVDGIACLIRCFQMSKRVLIADDSQIARTAIRSLLARWPDVEVCGETRNGREAVDTALSLRPDLVILDVRMPELNGIEAASVIKRSLPETKTLLFTMYADYVGRVALAAGVDIILPKVNGLSSLIGAIEALLQ